jgi:hypothetical protein
MKSERVFNFIVGVVFSVIICFVAWLEIEQHKWLNTCALHTHGTVEREQCGETYEHDANGNISGSTVQWHYYVRSGSGKRIEYGATYEDE